MTLVVSQDNYVDSFVRQCQRLGVGGESIARCRLVGRAVECYFAVGGSRYGSLGETGCVREGSAESEFLRDLVEWSGVSSGGTFAAGGGAADGGVCGAREGGAAVVGEVAAEFELGRNEVKHCGASGPGVVVGPAGRRNATAVGCEAAGCVVDPAVLAGVGSDSSGEFDGSCRTAVRGSSGADSQGCVDGGCSGCGSGGQVVSERGSVDVSEVSAVVGAVGVGRGKHWKKNREKRQKKRAVKEFIPEWRRSARPLVDGSGGCVSDESVAGSVRTVDTRTGVEIAAAQTLAARRVAENERAEAEAKVAKKLAEHRLVALQDKDRTVAVQRLAAARYEQKINEAKAKSQASYKKCDESMKSLGSTGSAGELALKQAVKEARDNAKTLKYVQEQADLFYQYATPEVRRMVAEMPEPEMEDEFDVFGDCPSDYNDEQREAYYDDLNRRNAEHGLVGSSSVPPRRELTPEEFLKIEEEVRALSANQV